jgi:alpha-methylacyl-CoA racemase
VDAAMTDGAATLMSSIYGMFGAGLHGERRGSNLLDSGAPQYDVYRCADDEYVAIAPIEKKFRDELLARIGLDPAEFPDVDDPVQWPKARAMLAEVFARKPRQAWCDLLEGTDVCFAPVLSLAQAPQHPHNRARGTFVEIDGAVQPAPRPRFSRTAPPPPRSARQCEMDAAELLGRWTIDPARAETLIRAGIAR